MKKCVKLVISKNFFQFIWPETPVTAPKVFRKRHRSVNTPTNDAINDTKAIQIELGFNMTLCNCTTRHAEQRPNPEGLHYLWATNRCIWPMNASVLEKMKWNRR